MKEIIDIVSFIIIYAGSVDCDMPFNSVIILIDGSNRDNFVLFLSHYYCCFIAIGVVALVAWTHTLLGILKIELQVFHKFINGLYVILLALF